MATVLTRKQKKEEIPLRFQRRRELKKRAAELTEKGLVLGDIRMGDAPDRFRMCLIRAILVFMAVLGTIGGLVSAFSMPFSMPAVLIGFAILSTFSAFLYYNKITFYTGYVLVFLGFIVFSFRYYWYINSGYQAFMNEVYNHYSDFFHLLSVREATEFITDRYLTVTAAMLFLGWFLSILLNITIAGYMNLVETVLLTFLPLQIAFYIDLKPALPYLILLLSVYICVAFLQRSGNYTLPFRHHRAQHFETRKVGKNVRHLYLASSNGMLRIAAGAAVFSTAFLLITNALFSQDFSTSLVSNPVKDKTDQYVQAMVQNGLASLLDRYHATGGLARGKLGGVGSVNPDFETDLTVRFVPYATESVYLKAYTGITYQNNTFHEDYTAGNPNLYRDNLSAELLTRREVCAPHLTGYRAESEETSDVREDLFGKMWINNIDADTGYVYRPYYSYASTSEKEGAALGISETVQDYARINYADSYDMLDRRSVMNTFSDTEGKEDYELLYLPYESKLHYARNPEITEEYEQFVYATCLQIPSQLSDPLKDYWKEELKDELLSAMETRDEKLAAATTEEERFNAEQEYRLRLALALKYHFMNNYRYTMAPGATPMNRDTIEYFLNVQKRGYCAHFASSAAMLLRRVGIPTRYVEGYVITVSDISEAVTVDTDTDGWLLGDSPLEQTALIEVNVPDASAHAWIEIYIDGYGWIPYEMTPPSSSDPTVADGGNNFFAFLSNLITPTERDTGDPDADTEDSPSGTDVKNLFAGATSLSYLFRPLIVVSGAFVLFLLLSPLIRAFRRSLRLRRMLDKGDYSGALLLRFNEFLTKLRKRRLLPARNMSIREISAALDRLRPAGGADTVAEAPALTISAAAAPADPAIALLRDLLWSAAYASDRISAADYQKGCRTLSDLLKKLPGKRKK